MGNIMSFFFPQPAPASIEQVLEVTQDATEEAIEEPVGPVAEDIGLIENAKPESLMVEKKLEATQQTDEGLEVVEEAKLDDDINVLPASNDIMHEELTATEEASPEPANAEVKDSRIEAPKDVTPEPIRYEASENVDNSVIQENKNIEMLGSINDRDVELIEQTTDEPINPCLPVVADFEPGAEPLKVPTPEPVKDSTPEPPRAVTPEPVKVPTPEPSRALTPEPAKAPTPEPLRVLTPEPVKAQTPEPPRAITPEPVKTPTPEPPRALTPEPVKASMPEPPRAITPEPIKAPTPEPSMAPSPVPIEAEPTLEIDDISVTGIAKESSSETVAIVKDGGPEVEVIDLVEEDQVKMDDEEVSGGASGLRDILGGSKNVIEE